MSTDVVNVKEIKSAAGPRKANECLAEAKRLKPPAELFDKFWREGELALFFGASGIGKSVLAVQIADALARGTPLHGFVMPKGRRKVLYVDLSLSDPQFHARYGGSGDTPVPMSAKREKLSNAETASVRTRVSSLRPAFKFAENLYREVPPGDADLCDWIKRMVEENSFRVVIVDDLSAIKRTHDGIRETLACMRRLKRLRDQLGISILVLSDAFEPPDPWVSENDLKRSRVLCTVADSVFAMGRKRRPEGGRCIVQTRSRSAEVFWIMQNAPVGEIKRLVSGILGFEFDERFTPEMDEDKRRLICEIRAMHDAGASYREIAKDLGISKTWACKLYKKWTPAMGSGQLTVDSGQLNSDADDDHWEDGNEQWSVRSPTVREGAEAGSNDDWQPPKEAYRGEHTDQYLMSLGMRPVWKEKWEAEGVFPSVSSVHSVVDSCVDCAAEDETETTEHTEHTEQDTEFSTLHSPLSTRLDGYGREIFVESELPNGKPLVWYHFDKKGNKIRCERGMFGITSKHLNTSPFL